MVTIVIVVIFFWLLASIRAQLVMILEESRKGNNPMQPPVHYNCRSDFKSIPGHELMPETEITKDMVNKLKNRA